MKHFTKTLLTAIFVVVLGGMVSLQAQYCDANGNNYSGGYINDFSTTGGYLNITNNNNGMQPNGYGDFTGTHQAGQSPTLSINFSMAFAPSGQTFASAIWVDWNQNGVFETSERVFSSNTYSSGYSGSFTVPANATPGLTRMRVSSNWLDTTGGDPCGSDAYGGTYTAEYEDYDFIVGSVDCEITCPADITIEAEVADCDGGAYVTIPAATINEDCLGSGMIENVIFEEGFDSGTLPTGWSVTRDGVVSNGSVGNCGTAAFAFNCTFDPFYGGLNGNFSGNFAVIDDDWDFGDSELKSIITPDIDMSGSAVSKRLSFAWTYTYISSDEFRVEVWNGSSWNQVFSHSGSDTNGFEDIDVSSYSNSDFKVRFTYDNDGYWAYGAGFDNVKVAFLEADPSGSGIVNSYNDGGANASDYYPVGTTNVTFTAIDLETGAPVTCTMSVTVVNTLEPEILCPADRTVTLQPGECEIFFYDFAPEVIGYCGSSGGAAEMCETINTFDQQDDGLACLNGFGDYGYMQVFSKEECGASGTINITGIETGFLQVFEGGDITISVYGYNTGTPVTWANLDLLYSETTAMPVVGGFSPLGGPVTEIWGYDFATPAQVDASYDGYAIEVMLPERSAGSSDFPLSLNGSGGTQTYWTGCATIDPEPMNMQAVGANSHWPLRVFMGGASPDGKYYAELCPGTYEYGDPLPIGDHEICWTFVDEDGNEYFCSYIITVAEYPMVNPTVACNDLIHVDLGKECYSCLNASHLLEGGAYGCFDTRYTIILAWDAGFTNIIGQGSEVCLDGSHAGSTIYGKVIDNVTGSNCSTEIKVFDTHIPDLECRSYTVDCGDDIYPDAEIEVVDGLVLNYSHDTVSIIDALACAGTGTAVNNYYRVFDMDLLGIPGDFIVEKFNLGIYQSFSDIPSTLRFYTFDNPSNYDVNAQSFSLSSATQIGDDIAVTIPNGLNTTVYSWDVSDEEIEIPLSARYVIVHIELPGNPADWVAGVNSAGEDGPSYLSSDDCGISDPSTYASIGFGDLHLVMMVYGSSGSGVGFPLPEGVTVVPTTGEGPFVVSGFDACGDVTMTYEDTVVQGDCSTEFATVIYRAWTAVDESGNTTSCQDTINIRHPDINNFVFPGDVEYLLSDYGCDHDFSTEDFGLEQGVCGMFYGWEDRVLELCGEGQKIIRDYYAMYCCSGEVVEGRQIIKIIDDIDPVIEACNPDVTISTGWYDCIADYPVPAISATKCGKDMNWPTDWTIVSSAGDVIISGNSVVIVNLPIGTHTVTYTVTDDCGNEASCVQLVTVRDDVPPIAVCDHNTRISIGADGEGRVHWTTIEDGSYDNCEIVKHEIRRKDVSRYCGRNNVWGEYVYFCCVDVGKVIEVEYRVTDASGNTNICIVNVSVENGIPPQMAAPGPVTVSCEFDALPSKDDLKSLFDSNQGAALSLLRDIFGKVADLDIGESRNDIIITDAGIRGCGYGNTTNNWGIDGFAVHNCGLNIKESYVDNRNECGVGRIFRSWQLLNDLDQPIGQPVNQVITVENCNPFGIADITWPRDLTITGNCGEYEEGEWGTPTLNLRNDCHMVAVTYTDEIYKLANDKCAYKILRHWTVINCCVDNKVPGNGIWTGIQEIKVDNITAAPVISFSYEAECNNGPDMCEMPVEFTATATGCLPSNMLTWSYRIDLFNDGTYDLSGTGYNFNRNIPAGNHRVEFTAVDFCENSTTQSFSFTVTDCAMPTPVCYADIATIVLPPSGCVTLDAKVFDAGSWDNCTDSEDLIFTYSSDVTETHRTFCCDDGLGTKNIEIWVTDAAGNQAYCVVTIQIQDPEVACGDYSLTGGVYTERNLPVAGIEVELDEMNYPLPLVRETDASGYYNFGITTGNTYTISATNNADVLNGVSTWDLTLIQQHILGMNEIVSPYTLIASDINRDGRITPVDLVELRRVILGLDKEFLNNSSWQMVVASEVLENGEVPSGYTQSIELADVQESMSGLDFVAVKVGDVNHSASLEGLRGVETRSSNEFVMSVDNVSFVKGAQVRVPVLAGATTEIYGYQTTVEISQNLRYAGIEAGAFDIDESNIGAHRVNEGLISMSWNDVNPVEVKEGEVLFTLVFDAIENGDLSHAFAANDVITRNEAYVNGEIDRVTIRVNADENGTFALYQNEPNPFLDITSISFDLPVSGAATLTVYDAQGRVEVILEGNYEAGRTTVDIKRDQLGAVGIKYYSLKSGDYTATKKMIVVK